MVSSTTDDRIQQRTGASGDAQHSLVGEVSANAQHVEQLGYSRMEQLTSSADSTWDVVVTGNSAKRGMSGSM